MRSFSIPLLLLTLAVLGAQTQDTKPSTSTGLISNHLPRLLPPLNMSPLELKVFAGHSFQLIKSKCPAVSRDKLTQLNKYIYKLVSKTNPAPKKSEQFLPLITSISTCAKKEISANEKEAMLESRRQGRVSTFMDSVRSKFHSMFGKSSEEVEVEEEDDEVFFPNPGTIMSFDETKDYTSRPHVDSEESTTTDKPEEQKEDSSSDVDDEQNKDANIAPSDSITPSTDSPLTYYSYYPMDTSYGSTSVMSWFGNLFEMMNKFLSSIFSWGGEDDQDDFEIDVISSTPSSSIPVEVVRERRSVEQLETITEEKRQDGSRSSSEFWVEKARKALADKRQAPTEAEGQRYFLIRLAEGQDDAAPAPTTKTTGHDAFVRFIDNLCKIYCEECSDRAEIINFKSAAKELLDFISTDTTGMQLAAKHYLDAEFLESLYEC